MALAKRLHPDRLGNVNEPEIKANAELIFRIATLAHDTLTDNYKRQEYISEARDSSASTRRRAPDERSKIAYHKGTVMLNKRAYGEAEKYLREATTASPDRAKFWQSLGWAIFQNSEGRTEAKRLEEARRCWTEAIKLEDTDATSHYYMALYWKAQDRPSKSRECLELALYHAPRYIEAKRELRLMEMRRRNQQGSGGSVLSRLFGSRKKR